MEELVTEKKENSSCKICKVPMNESHRTLHETIIGSVHLNTTAPVDSNDLRRGWMPGEVLCLVCFTPLFKYSSADAACDVQECSYCGFYFCSDECRNESWHNIKCPPELEETTTINPKDGRVNNPPLDEFRINVT